MSDLSKLSGVWELDLNASDSYEPVLKYFEFRYCREREKRGREGREREREGESTNDCVA
jgi:hypothetical protein